MLAECIQERRFFKPCIWSPFAKLLCGNSTLAHETLSLIPFFRLSKMYCTPTKVPKGQPTFFFCFRRSPRSVKKNGHGVRSPHVRSYFDLFSASEHEAGRRGNRQRRAPKQNGAFVARLRQIFRAGELFPLRRERHISRDGDRFARVVHLLAVLPADEGIAGSRFFAKRHHLAVIHLFRPRFAVQQNICDRERPGFPNSREFHIFIDGDVDFSVGSGRIAVPLIVLPALEQIPFLCGASTGTVVPFCTV